MKLKLYITGLTGMIALIGLGTYMFDHYNQPVYQPVSYSALKHSTGRADLNAQYYHMLRANPETGEIDFRDVLNARQEVRNYQSAKNAAADLHWEFMGPNFVGGRTRALIQDNQSTNSAIMYAGAVSGGLFISFNHGETWHDNTGNLTSLAVSCLAQTTNGKLFVGTGCQHDGISGSGKNDETGHPGDGLFRRDSDGSNGFVYTRLIGPSAANISPTADWRYINQIASSPIDENKLYVGGTGFWVTTNANASASEIQFTQPVPELAGGTIDDIVVSNDGKTIYVVRAASVYKLKDDGGSSISVVSSTSLTGGSGAIGRIALAMAPSDNNILYAAVSKPSGDWTTAGCLYGIFQSKDAGATWKLMGPGGSSFDPYANPGTNCQGEYDNTVAVFPDNPGKIIVGGISLWKWEESANVPGTGGWTQIAITQSSNNGIGDTSYVHADKHRILITTPNTVFIASDGGIGKSLDGGNIWGQNNDGYYVTQAYAIAAAAGVEVEFEGQVFLSEQIMGGNQDNGTQFVGFNSARPLNSVEIKGGDGFDCAFSNLGNFAFASSQFGHVSRHSVDNFGGETFYNAFLDSICTGNCGSFYTRFAYWEDPRVAKTYDSVKVFANTPKNPGDSLYYLSNIGFVPMAWSINQNMNSGDSVMLPDFAQSKFVLSVNSGLYITRDAPKTNKLTYSWYLLANGSSFPDPFPVSSVFSMEFSKDGDHLFVGTTGGSIYRISNLLQGYDSLTLDIRSGISVQTCTKIGDIGAIVTSIALDPNDPNNLIATTGGFGRSTYVYRTTTAASATTNGSSFAAIQGSLPKMPVYCSIIAEHDRNTVLIGTEFGIYGTDNAFSGIPDWSPANGGMPLVPVYSMVQQTNEYVYGIGTDNDRNAHYKKVYVGTCGRGFYRSTGLVGIKEGNPQIAKGTSNQLQLLVYPNPMNMNGTIALTLSESQHTVIQIFDLNGKLVNTVHNGEMSAGKQTINFGVSGLKNGTYLASVRTGDDMKVSKFVVLK